MLAAGAGGANSPFFPAGNVPAGRGASVYDGGGIRTGGCSSRTRIKRRCSSLTFGGRWVIISSDPVTWQRLTGLQGCWRLFPIFHPGFIPNPSLPYGSQVKRRDGARASRASNLFSLASPSGTSSTLGRISTAAGPHRITVDHRWSY